MPVCFVRPAINSGRALEIKRLFMLIRRGYLVFTALLLSAVLVLPGIAQKVGDGTASQRLEVMRQKLETMRRSLNSAISVLKDDAKEDKSKKDDKTALDTPLGRLRSLEKEVTSLQSEKSSRD